MVYNDWDWLNGWMNAWTNDWINERTNGNTCVVDDIGRDMQMCLRLGMVFSAGPEEFNAKEEINAWMIEIIRLNGWLNERTLRNFKKKHLSKVTIPIPLIGQTEKINGCFASLDAAQCPQAFFYKLCLQVVVIVYSVRLGFVLVDDGSPPTQVYSRLDNLQVIISHVDRLTSGFQKLVLLFITHSS